MEINKLIENGWLILDEAEELENSKEIKSCIDLCTSPQKSQIFNALICVPFKEVKVVILGKDPYPDPKDAHGLAFSSKDKSTPRSLINVFKSIDFTYKSDLLNEKNNDLTKWAQQGVLLLNTSLTFQKVDDKSLDLKSRKSLQGKTQLKHLKVWKPFINLIIKKILTVKDRPVVMMLWGNEAHNIVFGNIENDDFQQHLHERNSVIVPNTSVMLLQTSHPSPQAVNMGGDYLRTMPKHFKICDEYLGENTIDWTKL